ncbi:MAG: hypothetical protein COB46_07785 [Rhodospirillaceae bacterium]|nr:MAG: hypothetical protein COB46_07785 [Rhodospirillaceae bacterium]
MSDDPVQSIIAMLENIEGGVAGLTAEVHAARSASPHPRIKAEDIEAVQESAYDGANIATKQTIDRLNNKILDLQNIAGELKATVEPAKIAVVAQETSSWFVMSVFILVLLFSIAMAFLGGIYVTRSGSILSTEIGCKYFGARWSEKQDGSGFVCWR